jgi:RecB family endonuclease NucS
MSDIKLFKYSKASEYITTNKGRIDSLGLDENNCPVIIEYKRHANQNVINQGLFYLNWLLDHKGDLEVVVRTITDLDKAKALIERSYQGNLAIQPSGFLYTYNQTFA